MTNLLVFYYLYPVGESQPRYYHGMFSDSPLLVCLSTYLSFCLSDTVFPLKFQLGGFVYPLLLKNGGIKKKIGVQNRTSMDTTKLLKSLNYNENQNPQWMNLNNPLLLSKSTVMISHGMPDKLVGKGKIVHDKKFLLFQQFFKPFQMIF